MLSQQQLNGRIAAYASGEISLGGFQDWLQDASVDPIPSDLEDLVFSIEAALSEQQFGGLSQQKLRTKLQELAKAVRPLASPAESVKIVVYQYPKHSFSATAAAAMFLSAAPSMAIRLAVAVDARGSGKPVVVGNPSKDAGFSTESISLVYGE